MKAKAYALTSSPFDWKSKPTTELPSHWKVGGAQPRAQLAAARRVEAANGDVLKGTPPTLLLTGLSKPKKKRAHNLPAKRTP